MTRPLRVSAHRWAGLVLSVPFVLWTITGLLFHLKPGWGRAYDMLSERTPGPIAMAEVVPATAAVQASGAGADANAGVSRLELLPTVLGPVYRIDRSGAVALVDARTGRVLSPLDAEQGRALAVDAVARSAHAAGYGTVKQVDTDDHDVVVRFSAGPVVRVARDSARLSQHGPDTARIDWLYRVHYLQWTGVGWLDRGLSLTAIAGTWLLCAIGISLFIRRAR